MIVNKSRQIQISSTVDTIQSSQPRESLDKRPPPPNCMVYYSEQKTSFSSNGSVSIPLVKKFGEAKLLEPFHRADILYCSQHKMVDQVQKTSNSARNSGDILPEPLRITIIYKYTDF